jgi:hypothetical protein
VVEQIAAYACLRLDRTSARLRGGGRRDDMPLFPSLRNLLGHDELHLRRLFTVVEGDALVEWLIAAAQAIVGDFDTANTGLLFGVLVERALGLRRDR